MSHSWKLLMCHEKETLKWLWNYVVSTNRIQVKWQKMSTVIVTWTYCRYINVSTMKDMFCGYWTWYLYCCRAHPFPPSFLFLQGAWIKESSADVAFRLVKCLIRMQNLWRHLLIWFIMTNLFFFFLWFPVVGELQQHLQSIFFLLRSQDTITLVSFTD